MPATDKIRLLPAITPPAAQNNVRATSTGENNVRTERYQLRIRGQVDITVAGAALSNRGSILATMSELGFSDGGQDRQVWDPRLARFVADQLAPSPLPATRLAGAGVQAATQLEEIVPLWMSAPRTINLNETKYVEANKQLQQTPFINPVRAITNVANGAALAGTVTNLTATIEQVYDELTDIPPWLSCYVRQVVQDVPGANPALKIDLRGTRYGRGIAIQQDTTQGEVSDIINAIVLRGDKKSLIGDRAVPWRDLVLAQGYENGGALPDGYLFIDFARYGRLTGMWNPAQDTNLRLEVDCQPSVTVFAGAPATGSRIRVAMVEYEQTPATISELPLNV